MNFQESGWSFGLDWSGSGQAQVAGSCKSGRGGDRVPKNTTNFLTVIETITFSRINMLHGLINLLKKSRVSAVGIEATPRAQWDSNPISAKKYFSIPKQPDGLLDPTQPPIQLVSGFFPYVQQARPGNDADPSPPSSAEVKNEWSNTSAHYRPSCRGKGQLYLCLVHAQYMTLKFK
jgi:hypothetical protein